MTLQLYDVPTDVRALSDECATCHNEQYVDAVTGDPCPDCAGDATKVLDRYLDAYREMKVQEAVEYLACRVVELEQEAEVLQFHAQKIANRASARTAAAKHVRAWLQMQMHANGVQKVKSVFGTVYLQDSRETIDIIDEERVPEAHKRAKLQMPLADVPDELTAFVYRTEVMKTPLLEHLRETGEIPPGCAYRPKGETQHLVIRS